MNLKISGWYEYYSEKKSYFEQIGSLDDFHKIAMKVEWENKTREYGISFYWYNITNERDSLKGLPYRDSYAFLNFEWRF